jgi:hypothetical protein
MVDTLVVEVGPNGEPALEQREAWLVSGQPDHTHRDYPDNKPECCTTLLTIVA